MVCGPDGKGGDEGAGALHGAKRTPGQPEMPPSKTKSTSFFKFDFPYFFW
jgi:hypothetical protein